MMHSLPNPYKAIVIGAHGAIGGAMVAHLQADAQCALVVPLSRQSSPAIDWLDETSISQTALQLADQGPFHLLLIATGVLHNATMQPEKRLAHLQQAQMMHNFAINTVGPALALAQFAPLMAKKERSLIGVLSAKVGSIGDNRMGGWVSYRAAKAALNMVIKTAAIEIARTHPLCTMAALHPGTVESALSAPFNSNHPTKPATQAAQELLSVLNQRQPEETGGFWAYDGQELPW